MWRSLFPKSGMITFNRIAALLFGALLALTGVDQLSAQLSTAAINGTVHDPSGAVIPGATLTLIEVQTSVQRVATSNSAGAYVFTSLTPGRYTMEASATGFQPEKIAEFVLAVGQTGTYDFKMTVGSTTAVVTVQAENQQLDVTSANLGTELPT